ncbi:plasmid partitioning protein RepB C-terminal domain-containing protein [Paramagnetospirillum magneticum]|uniref:Predicted transcriptional regulator n=1 Tax=Paramagnetospirillum magneticum (strain ATCC 700264 / AMB-1) TaxID=342108 RepID=Q2W826_PARM1|nr:plasmid partitioning protein RepB C-terminal domain-containing protein [Paramagnetospirillum magneticum]BAE49999.1 Predicted transcriptional regulator [Paramagnetospirillum magneticum AMB-1]
MARKPPPGPVQMAFERRSQRIAFADIQPLRLVGPAVKKTPKYAQIAASIRDVGIVEPPVVAKDRSEEGKYLLLDGHLRIEILKEMGETSTDCLIATDDEGFTYNKRINRIAIVQEHRMILKAIEDGVPEERIASSLNVDVAYLRRKTAILNGICPEVVELLQDKHVPINTFDQLKKMLPIRQIEAAQLMIAMNKYSINYAKSLVSATPASQLINQKGAKRINGLTDEQIALMEEESAKLDREFRQIERSYGSDHLDLVVINGFLDRLLGNNRIVRYLTLNYPELQAEFQRVTDSQKSAG